METTGYLSQKTASNTLLCLVRGRVVAATPEEKVRQKWLKKLILELGFPVGQVAVEVALNKLPHLCLSSHTIPKRRLDIVCFTRANDGSLLPLLILECKAESLNDKAYQQVMGYQRFASGCFLALCNERDVRVGFFEKTEKKWFFTDKIPSYHELTTLDFLK